MGALSLPICLRVVSSGEQSASPHQLPQGSPQVTSEPRVSIMYQGLWYSKLTNYVVKQKLCYLPRTKKATTHCTGHQLYQLGQSVHNGQDGVEPLGLRQVSDKI